MNKEKYIIINMDCMEIVEGFFEDAETLNFTLTDTFINYCDMDIQSFKECYKVFKVSEVPVSFTKPSVSISL
jgi:hypothetical protein